MNPVDCAYAPPGEYVKDHTFVFHEGWWHVFSISGIEGFCHAYNGNEETISWSISRDLVNWQMRGHVLHASQREGAFDQHEIWAPFCFHAEGRFHLFYTGIVHPHRPMEYRKIGHDHRFDWRGHRETQGLAVSTDLTDWTKVSDVASGLGIPGRDSHVVRDDARGRWLLYSTGPRRDNLSEAFVSESSDLRQWTFLGTCARFPDFPGGTAVTTESLTVMKHPLNGRWIMLANHHYALSNDPTRFPEEAVRTYDLSHQGRATEIGFAGEIIQHDGRWFRSGVIGPRDFWKLGFTEIGWNADGAFHILAPSRMVG